MINEQDFKRYLTIKERSSPQTIRHCLIRLRVISRWLTEHNKELSQEVVEQFIFSLSEKGLSNAAINTYVLVLKYLERFLQSTDTPLVLLDGIKSFPKVRLKPIEILTQDQVDALLAVRLTYKPFNGKDTSRLDVVYRTFLTALSVTGARFSEMADLKVMYVDLDWGKITFAATTTKTKTERSVFITEPLVGLLKVLTENKKPDELVFQNMKGNRIREQEFSLDIKKRGVQAGITKRVHPHLLRHTYATHLYVATRDIGLVQMVLGHKDIKSTMIYIQIADDVIRQGMYTHPFVRQHVKAETTIASVKKQLDVLKLPEDSRFDSRKVSLAMTNFFSNLKDAIILLLICVSYLTIS